MRKPATIMLLALASIAFLYNAASAQLPVPTPKPIIGARMPALSPDGKKLAFVYRGDVWVADSTGGRAITLTRNVAMDAFPRFSPDGKWVSFASARNGNWDIYVIPAVGGEAKRLTYNSANDVSYGWSPDGKSLVFNTTRDTDNGELCALDVATLRLHKIAEDYMAMDFSSYSPDGKTIVYGRNSFFRWSRPRYAGSGAAQIWTVDVKTGARKQITNTERQHLWTQFMPDGKNLLTVTTGEVTPSASKMNESIGKIVDSPVRTPNLWLLDLSGKGRQLTTFIGGSVRFPVVASKTGDIAFEYEHDLWLLPAGVKTPTKIALYASEDETQNSIRHQTLTSGANELELSPDGKTLVFGLEDDIWSTPVERPKTVEGKENEIARRLTDWAGDDSDFIWSQDGKKIYFTSDREFNTRLYELDIESQKVKSLWDRPEDVSTIRPSPDGKEIGFWVTGAEGGLYTITLETGQTRRLFKMPGIQMFGYGGGGFAWSPDMQWMAYCFNETNGARNVWIMPAVGGEGKNVTDLNAFHEQPVWSPDGKYLFFQSNRDGEGLYVLPLKKEPARTADFNIKFEKPTDPVKVEIDFDDTVGRIRKISSQNPERDLRITSEGTLLFISDNDVWSVTYDGKETKRLTNGGGCSVIREDKEGKKTYIVRNGELWTMPLDDTNKLEKIEFKADWDKDVRAEHKAAFTKLWRFYNRNFYDPNMHGRDWEAIRDRYEPMLESVETPEEMSNLLGMMVGELESSHSEVGPARNGAPSVETPHLGFTFDYSYTGPGILVGKVPPGTPGSFTQTEIKPGEYVLAIDGQDVTVDENLFKFINDKVGREMEFLINSKPTKEGARTVKYASLKWDEWGSLSYKNRLDERQKHVEESGDGKIGYVHIPGMGEEDKKRFEREFYQYALGKKAMIIDVRYNGGGYISDDLIDWLERRPHGFTSTRNEEPPVQTPGMVWDKPIIVLINESSYSNAEVFANAMRTRRLAKLVGIPTPGYLIAVYELPLVDGTRARMPFIGFYRMDGTPQENNGEKPDIYVTLNADDWVSGNDPQLDKAIEMLLEGVRN